MKFFVSLLVDGAPAGAVYALFARAFVGVYKASRVIGRSVRPYGLFGRPDVERV